MSAGDLKAAIGPVLEGAYSTGVLDTLDDLYAAGVLCHWPPLPDLQGLGALKEYVADMCSAFSDIQLVIDKAILGGDAVALLWTFRASHTGQSPVMPIPPTGRRANITGSTINSWANGKIVEEWSHADWLGLFRQLGVIPPMG